MEKLLIVDDEEGMRRVLRLNLEDRYEIIDTGDPTEALALALQERPDAILLDLRMPQYSGYELCRTFNSLSATQLTPLFIVSGEPGSGVKALCQQLGATAFFEKPVDYEALRARLADVLQATRPERRRERRVHLRVMLTLKGADATGAPFEQSSETDNISQGGFLCGCSVPLAIGAIVEVFMAGAGAPLVGTARVVRAEATETQYPRYGFQFVEQTGAWVLN